MEIDNNGSQRTLNALHTVIVKEPCIIFEAKDGPYEPLTSEDVWSSIKSIKVDSRYARICCVSAVWFIFLLSLTFIKFVDLWAQRQTSVGDL